MSRSNRTFKHLCRCETGATAVEFSLIFMALIAISLGIIEFGRGLYLYNKLSYAADLAARRGLTMSGSTDEQLKSEVLTAFAGGEPLPNVVIEPMPEGTVSEIDFRTVVIEVAFEPLIPGLIFDAINLSVTRRIPTLP